MAEKCSDPHTTESGILYTCLRLEGHEGKHEFVGITWDNEGETVEQTFAKGDIVTEDPLYMLGEPHGEGEVVAVEEDGYVSVRFANGYVWAYWPKELVQTGKKLDPAVLEVLDRLDKAINDAAATVSKLNQLRDGVVALGLKED